MDEDTIDTEALQAQIDLSMSFAQNLISSWVQPHKIPRNPYKKDLEKELSEYMQRPARLGVGASIPEGYNSAYRETARLKGKLAGTKHSREDDGTIALQQLTDSEGESKAISIKRRSKHDPFDVAHGKKKKKTKIDHEYANLQSITASTCTRQLQAPEEAADPYLDGPESNSLILSPSKRKKNRKKIKAENEVEGCEAGASSTLLFNGLNPPSTPPRSAELDIDTTPRNQRTVDVSLTSTPALVIQTRHKSISLDVLKMPLLNLNGPHSDHDSNHEGTPPGSSKKKRKRRRKKKNVLILSASSTKIDETGDVSSSLR